MQDSIQGACIFYINNKMSVLLILLKRKFCFIELCGLQADGLL